MKGLFQIRSDKCKNTCKKTNRKADDVAKRSFPTFDENPFMNGLQIQTTKKKIEIRGKGNNIGFINYDTGETEPAFGTYAIKEVDKTQFVKVFADGIAGLLGLTSAGLKVFKIIYDRMVGSPGKDEILLDYRDIVKKYPKLKMSEATFSRGLTEVLKHNFLARSHIYNLYYVNPKYIFNGDRLQLVQEFVLKGSKAADKRRKELNGTQTEQCDLFNQDIEVEGKT